LTCGNQDIIVIETTELITPGGHPPWVAKKIGNKDLSFPMMKLE
jgi:hypothetical protein